jgi:5'(3')-deoxyribonucleotidase
MIYVDMDGVLANLYDYMTLRLFKKKFTELSKDQEDILRKVFDDKHYFNFYFPEGCEGVFDRLEPFEFNKALIETVVEYGGKYAILSRPCKLDINGSKKAKIRWVEKHLSFCPPEKVLLVIDKSANVRAKGNVLIDDWHAFLTRWEEKGGIAVKYKAVDYKKEEDVRKYLREKLINISHGL